MNACFAGGTELARSWVPFIHDPQLLVRDPHGLLAGRRMQPSEDYDLIGFGEDGQLKVAEDCLYSKEDADAWNAVVRITEPKVRIDDDEALLVSGMVHEGFVPFAYHMPTANHDASGRPVNLQHLFSIPEMTKNGQPAAWEFTNQACKVPDMLGALVMLRFGRIFYDGGIQARPLNALTTFVLDRDYFSRGEQWNDKIAEHKPDGSVVTPFELFHASFRGGSHVHRVRRR